MNPHSTSVVEYSTRCLLNILLIVVPLSIASTTYAQFTTVINVPPDMSPSSIGADTQLNLFDGGAIPAFFDAGNPSGTSTNVEVNITGGSVGDFFDAYGGSTVNVTGGFVGFSFDANNGSEVNISGGSVGGGFDANDGSEVNISAGSIGDQFDANGGSIIAISGGSFGGRFNVYSGSQVNITGKQFLLDGVEVTGLTAGQPQTLSDREATLTGLFGDMTPFSFELNSTPVFGQDFFSADAMLTLTLLNLSLTGDYNANGVVDAADYVLWRKTLSQTGTGLAADGNGNGQIDAGDYDIWRAHFGQAIGSGSTLNSAYASRAVPEPTSLVLILCAAVYRALRRVPSSAPLCVPINSL